MDRGRAVFGSVRKARTVRERAVRRVFFVFSLAFIFDPLCFCVLIGRGFGRSACVGRTVRGCLADSPRGSCGQSAPAGRTVRQSLAALFLGSIPPSFFRASPCASRNRS
jgi:hypothetical protein